MSQAFAYYKEKKKLKKIKANNKLIESKILDELDTLLEKMLTDNIEEVVFEVSPKIVAHIISIVDLPPIVNKYSIVQVNKSLFSARLRAIEI